MNLNGDYINQREWGHSTKLRIYLEVTNTELQSRKFLSKIIKRNFIQIYTENPDIFYTIFKEIYTGKICKLFKRVQIWTHI